MVIMMAGLTIFFIFMVTAWMDFIIDVKLGEDIDGNYVT